MALVLAVALVAYVLGRLAGGTLPRLASVPVRGVRLLLVALLLHVTGGALAGQAPYAYGVAVACSSLFVTLFAWRNRRVVGVPLLGAGLLANILVVVANGAMPVSVEAAVRAGVPASRAAQADDARREPVTDRTHLGLLADRLPVALPLRPDVASLGDVLAAAGVGLFVAGGMNAPRRRPPGPRARPRPPSGRPAGPLEHPRSPRARVGA